MYKSSFKFYFLCLFIIIFTCIIYFKGLFGDYVFDDPVNILENKKIQISSLDFYSLKAAALSGDAGPLGRPVSMLSFAINYYFTGFNPFYFKLTNLVIHLLNGVIIFIFSKQILLNLLNNNENKAKNLALIVMLIWLVHPLNLTSILYVVQRMTSLATLFGFMAIMWYCLWRNNLKTTKNTVGYFILILISLLLSVFSKESGVLFLLLIYWIELTIFQGRDLSGQAINIKSIKLIHVLWCIGFLGFFALCYIAIPFTDSSNFLRRDFSLSERLFTEARVIFLYLKLFFLPTLSDLSLYHDDFLISKSVLDPITTLYSLIALISITFLCIVLYKKYPIALFAWGWFLISQLLESTVVSLELIHEHRNYFSTIGFIILFVCLFSKIEKKTTKLSLYVLASVYIANLSFTTLQRSLIWSNLVDQAAFDAATHPKSDRANYQMARIYIKLMQNDPSHKAKYVALAQSYLDKSKQSYLSGNGAWFAELHLASYLGKQPQQQDIDQLVERLTNKPFYNNNTGFLVAFSQCQIQGYCKVPHEQAVRIISAGLDNKTITPDLKAEIYKLLAQYYISLAQDFVKGEEFLNDALKLKNDVGVHLLLSQTYRLQGRIADAQHQLNIAQQLDVSHIWLSEISIEQHKILESTSNDKGKKREN